jgi:CBS domain-containing protein
MTVQAHTVLPERLLEIRTLHVLSGSGETAELHSVRCPSRGRSLPLEVCLACPDGAGVFPAPPGRPEQVSCRGAPSGRGPASGQGAGTEADRTAVSAVMTARVLAVRPDVSLEALAGMLLDRGISGAPVVDQEGRPLGVVSKTDLMRERLMSGDTGEVMTPGWQPRRGHFQVEVGRGFHAEAVPALVADVMTPSALTLSEDAPVAEAAALMAFEGVHRVPVVADDGRVAGIVTSLDVLRWVAQQDGYLTAGRRGAVPGASA